MKRLLIANYSFILSLYLYFAIVSNTPLLVTTYPSYSFHLFAVTRANDVPILPFLLPFRIIQVNYNPWQEKNGEIMQARSLFIANPE